MARYASFVLTTCTARIVHVPVHLRTRPTHLPLPLHLQQRHVEVCVGGAVAVQGRLLALAWDGCNWGQILGSILVYLAAVKRFLGAFTGVIRETCYLPDVPSVQPNVLM